MPVPSQRSKLSGRSLTSIVQQAKLYDSCDGTGVQYLTHHLQVTCSTGGGICATDLVASASTAALTAAAARTAVAPAIALVVTLLLPQLVSVPRSTAYNYCNGAAYSGTEWPLVACHDTFACLLP